MSATGQLASAFADVIGEVDSNIGENKTYGAGIGPHDGDDQIDALVDAVMTQNSFPGYVATAKSDASAVWYPNGRRADLVIEHDGTTEYCEAKLYRFQKANENPSREVSAKCSIPSRTATRSRSSTM